MVYKNLYSIELEKYITTNNATAPYYQFTKTIIYQYSLEMIYNAKVYLSYWETGNLISFCLQCSNPLNLIFSVSKRLVFTRCYR